MNRRTKVIASLLILAIVPSVIWATQETSQDSERNVSVISRSQSDFSWIYVRQDGGMTIGAGHLDDWEQLKHQGNPYHGDYLWIKNAGIRYVITDPVLVAQIKTAIIPMQLQGEKMQIISEQMQQKNESMEVLGQQMERLSQVHESLAIEAENQVFTLTQAAIKAGTVIVAP